MCNRNPSPIPNPNPVRNPAQSPHPKLAPSQVWKLGQYPTPTSQRPHRLPVPLLIPMAGMMVVAVGQCPRNTERWLGGHFSSPGCGLSNDASNYPILVFQPHAGEPQKLSEYGLCVHAHLCRPQRLTVAHEPPSQPKSRSLSSSATNSSRD